MPRANLTYFFCKILILNSYYSEIGPGINGGLKIWKIMRERVYIFNY